MKSYIMGVVIGLALAAGTYFAINKIISIPPAKQDSAAIEMTRKAIDFEKSGDIKAAVKMYKKIVRKCSSSGWAELSLYKVFEIYAKTDKKEMLKTADWYLKKFPKKRGSEIAARAGEYYLYESPSPEKARALFIHAVNLATSAQWAIRAQERMADYYYRQKDYDKLIEMNNKLINSLGDKINSDHYRILNLKAYWRQGKQKEAYAEAKKIKNNQQPLVKNEILYWKVISKFESKNAEALMYLGDAYMRIGFKDQAAGYWRDAAKISPKNTAIKKRLQR
ncbi:hypothetical protein KJ633_04205 [bacterium]|nr:hypothetical protein [bacterium]MBU3955642.1 hypothetical protein [bacterium]